MLWCILVQHTTIERDAMAGASRETSDLRELRDLSPAEVDQLVYDLGLPKFRRKQLVEWVWGKRATSFDDMTNLPKDLRATLAESYTVDAPHEAARQVSRLDGTRKYLLSFADGKSVECVGMPGARGKLAACVSTQAGCAMGCAFCATGKAGLVGSLSAAQIFDQVAWIADDFGQRVTSVVFMGQGEPFANYDATLRALRWLNADEGMGIGARHLTVSTCGILPGIHQFAAEPEQFTLAVSLHSAVQPTRDLLMPGVRKYSLVHLRAALREYVAATGRRPTYEYALIAGVNDTREHLDALVQFCEGDLCHVNLIQLNNVPGSPFKPSSEERAYEFVNRLAGIGVEATIRESRGPDIDAACGQLRQRMK